MIFKKILRGVLALTMGCMASASFAGCSFFNQSKGTVYEESEAIRMTTFDEPVSLIDGYIASYLSADPSMLVTDFLYYGTKRLDKGNPVTVGYDILLPDGAPIQEETLDVSLSKDFSKVEQSLSFSPAYIYNLLPNTTYYCRAKIVLENGDVHTKTSSFITAASPRFINLDGASNVRDIGGWKTESGKTIQYGLLYRGSEIDGGKNVGHPDFCLTEKGVKQLRALGIKTDFDLRSENNKVDEFSILGEEVNRSFYDAPQYQSFFQESRKESVRKIFSDLARPEAYPVYLHCTHGVDRAGSTTLILESLLGVSKEDLIRDYELSAFYHNYKHVNRNVENGGTILKLIEGLESYTGETLADKTAAFLLSVGVTEAEIASIRNIFLP